MQPVSLNGIEFAALCAVLTGLTAAIAWCIKWGVETLSRELSELSQSIGGLRDELHRLAMRVLSLEEWRKSVSPRRHDDPPDSPSPIRWTPSD